MDNATEECHRTFACIVPKLCVDDGSADIDMFTVNTSEGVVTTFCPLGGYERIFLICEYSIQVTH